MLRAAAAGCCRRTFSFTAVRARNLPLGLAQEVIRPHPKAKDKPLLPPPPVTWTDAQWASIKPTKFTVFHNPADTTSTRILATLNDAILEYPPLRKSTPRYPPRQLRAPLKLTLNVIARAPTAAEFCAILAHSPGFSIASFVRTTQTKDWPTNVDALVALVEKDPTLLAWPVIVDWKYGESSIGGKGCIKLLDAALHRRNKALKPRDKRLKKQRSMY